MTFFSSCGYGFIFPVSARSSTLTRRGFPNSIDFLSRLSRLSSASTSNFTWSYIAPLSTSGTTSIMLTPPTLSPFSSVLIIGVGPLYFGRSDGCTLNQFASVSSNNFPGNIFPKEATTTASGFNLLNLSKKMPSNFSICIKSIPSSMALLFTTLGTVFLPLPVGLWAVVTTRDILCRDLYIPSRNGTEIFEEPKNNIFKGSLLIFLQYLI